MSQEVVENGLNVKHERSSAFDEDTKTPRSNPGFSERLKRIFDSLGQKEHGRVSLVASYTGVSAAGAKYFIEHDNPPKHLAKFKTLVTNLHRDMIEGGFFLSMDELFNHLLYGNTDIYGGAAAPNKKEVNTHQSGIQSRELYLLHVALFKRAKEKDIDLEVDVSPEQLKKILDKISTHYFKEKPELQSEKFISTLDGMLVLAMGELL